MTGINQRRIDRCLKALKSLNGPQKSSAVIRPALAFLFTAIILHEFSHSALVWYGEGRFNRDTPKLGEFNREAGEFIEMKLSGEIVEGAYDLDSKTEDIKNVGLVIAMTFIQYWISITHHYQMLIFKLDNNRAVELSKLDTTKGLGVPCFNTSGVSPDPKPHRCLSLKSSVRKC